MAGRFHHRKPRQRRMHLELGDVTEAMLYDCYQANDELKKNTSWEEAKACPVIYKLLQIEAAVAYKGRANHGK